MSFKAQLSALLVAASLIELDDMDAGLMEAETETVSVIIREHEREVFFLDQEVEVDEGGVALVADVDGIEHRLFLAKVREIRASDISA
jgi:hypothetical protein